MFSNGKPQERIFIRFTEHFPDINVAMAAQLLLLEIAFNLFETTAISTRVLW